MKKAYKFLLHFINGERKNIPLLSLLFFCLGISLYFTLNKFIIFTITPLVFILSLWANTIKKIVIKYNLLHPSQILRFLFFKLFKLIFLLFLLPLISPFIVFFVSLSIVTKILTWIKLFVPFSLFGSLWIFIKKIFSFLPWAAIKSTSVSQYLISFLSQPFNYFKELLERFKSLKKKIMKKIVKVLNKYKLQKFKKYIFARKHKMKIPFKPSFKLSPATFLGYLSFAFFFGFLIMHLQTVFNSTKLLQYDVRNKDITGQISNIEKRSLDYRVTLKNIKIAFDDTEYKKIRVKTNNVNNLHIGDKISFKGSLFAPSGPSSDSGFNFKRWAFYEGFSATGYVNDKIEILDKGILSFKEHIANLRVKIINKLSESSMEGNLFAITILTGERYALPDESQEIFQKAGISHLLSVSGFHMGLIALITFFLIRYFILLLFPSQMFDGKKLTAILTFPIITAFYFLSGMAIPATRSFIMILVFLISVIKGRKVLSLNNLGLAGFIILCLYPYSLFSAGFQLSFAATAVIIYLFNKK